MFNAKRFFTFWGKTSKLLIPAAIIAVLAIFTEILTQPLFPLDDFLLQSGFSLVIYIAVYMVIVAVIFVFAGRFMASFYDLGGTREGFSAVIRLMFGKSGFGPVVTVSGGQITHGQDTVVTKLGGPAGLVIHNDTAVVTEKRGKLNRVLGPGLPVLEPFEKIYDVVDLRPKRWLLSVNAMTKEGIPVTWDAEIRYQIDDGGQEPTQAAPYPFSEEAIFKAATGKWRREVGRTQDMDWEGWVVVSQTEGTLRGIIAREYLDELIGLSQEESLAVREAVQKELTGIIREAAPKMGAKLLDIRLQSLQVKDEVTEQWIEAWQTRWQSWSTEQLAPREAGRIQEYEKAKAMAHLQPLNRLTQELEKLEHADQAVILWRLSSVLDQGTMGSGSRVFFPGEAVETIEHIRGILRGANLGDDDDEDHQQNGSPKFELPAVGSAVPREIIRILPLFDEIAAGQEKPIVDDVLGYIQQFDELEFELDGQILMAQSLRGQQWLSFSKECSYIAVKISGDSMNRAGIDLGDYVILQHKGVGSFSPTTGDIVAVVFHDEEDNKATLKRLEKQPDGVILKPESLNTLHQPRRVPPRAFAGDSPMVEIIGIATAVLKPQEFTI